MRFFIFITVCLLSLSSFAQNQIAVLNHNGEISTHYGANALREAYNKAEDGDVITLSAGTFNAVDIKKLITIRGAGMGIRTTDTETIEEPTILTGIFNVTADDNESNHFILEGVECSSRIALRGIRGSQFIKCHFSEINFEANYGLLENCTFIHCVSEKFNSMYTMNNTTLSGVNCVFRNAVFTGDSNLLTLTNCIIELMDCFVHDAFDCASLQNCICISPNAQKFTTQTNIYYTLWAGPHSGDTPFTNLSDNSHNNYVVASTDNLFKDGTFYQLTDEAKATYLGSDGKEIGIYGGNIPFTPQLTTAQITRFDVSPRTTADGKLSIDIEIQANE